VRSRSLAVSAVLVLASGLVGCAKKPSMHLNHAEVSGVQVAFPPSLAVVMTVVVDVYNPNSYDVAIRRVHGTLTMADKYVMPMDWAPPGDGVWLTADGITQVRVPITIPVDIALRIRNETFTAPSVPYRFVGRADVTATRTLKIEKDDYSVDERGWISRQQVEQAVRLGF
jgi:hypothetical protein